MKLFWWGHVTDVLYKWIAYEVKKSIFQIRKIGQVKTCGKVEKNLKSEFFYIKIF